MTPEIGDHKEENGKDLFWNGEEWAELPNLTEDYPQIEITFPGIFRFTPKEDK